MPASRMSVSYCGAWRRHVFDTATADRLAQALAAEADPERLAAVGEAIVRCSTGDQLLRETGIST